MWNNLRITQRFLLVLCGCWLSGVAVIAVSYWGLSSARDGLKAVHEHAMALALRAADVADLTVQNRLQVMLAFQHAPDNPLAREGKGVRPLSFRRHPNRSAGATQYVASISHDRPAARYIARIG